MSPSQFISYSEAAKKWLAPGLIAVLGWVWAQNVRELGDLRRDMSTDLKTIQAQMADIRVEVARLQVELQMHRAREAKEAD